MTLAIYIVGGLLLALAQTYALSNRTDSEQPLTYYIRRFFYSFGALGMFALLVIWLWLGCHFILDTTGSLPC
jgi:hypothetical protein